ncbi:DUF397 domain-containing protein [Streptomyces canus]|uniref:DUF397 domain-containing protein n=1 Tax=Streptomyces canus TaxID=58343 RepID=UPI0033BC9DC1
MVFNSPGGSGGSGSATVHREDQPEGAAGDRDSKTPARATLTFLPGTFTAFLEALKSPHSTA